MNCWLKIPEAVKIIDSSSKTNEEKCRGMLEKWLDSSNIPCYHDLIKALEEHSLYNASEIVKKQAAKEIVKRE